MTPPRRILLVRLSHLGDVAHALPVYHALRAGYPDATLAWAVQPEFADLVEELPGLDRVVRFDRRRGPRAWAPLHAELARYGADWAVDAQGNVKSALVTLASGAARRTGYHPAEWTERFAAHGMTDTAPRSAAAGTPAHALDRALALARYVAPHVAEAGHRARVDPALSPAERSVGRAALAQALGPDAERGVLLHLSAPGDVRSWPQEHAVALARALAERGVPTLVLSGPAEEAVGRAVRAALAGTAVRHLVGQRGLRALAGLCAAAAERGFRLVACDSGPLHVAAASGLATVVLAGPQDPRRTGPWPVPAAALGGGPAARRSTDSPHRVATAHAAPACMPCRARRCAHTDGPVCMTGLAPEDVLAALDLGASTAGAPRAEHRPPLEPAAAGRPRRTG